MKRGTTMLSAFAVALAFVLPGWAQIKELPKQTVTVAGTVETIDKNIRAVNIKTADGKFVAVDVPASAKRFDELKVERFLKVTYNNNVYARLKPASEAAVDTAATASNMGKEARPGGAGGDGADDDGNSQRHRQDRVVDDILKGRMGGNPARADRRSEGLRSGQSWRPGRHHLEHRRHLSWWSSPDRFFRSPAVARILVFVSAERLHPSAGTCAVPPDGSHPQSGQSSGGTSISIRALTSDGAGPSFDGQAQFEPLFRAPITRPRNSFNAASSLIQRTTTTRSCSQST